MNQLSKDTKITETGEAIIQNARALKIMQDMFISTLGPCSSYKMIISKAGELKITSDGCTITQDLNFTNPTCLLVKNGAQQSTKIIGDGATSYIILCTELFMQSFNFYLNGSSVHNIISGMREGIKFSLEYLNTNKKSYESDTPKKITLNALSTKIGSQLSEKITDCVTKAFDCLIKNSKTELQTEMIEILKMPHDYKSCDFVEGLVLDHAGRNDNMPNKLENCFVMTSNLSLEYEKTEINSNFNYANAETRNIYAKKEREFSVKNAKKIVEFANFLKIKTGKNLIFITDKGIDPYNLEILAEARILGLRRAKRRNLERLLKSCGGNLITHLAQLESTEENLKSLGFCEKVEVKKIGDEKFTFLSGTQLKGSCTILVKGNNLIESNRIVDAIKSAIMSLKVGYKTPYFLHGGPKMFYLMSKYVNEKVKSCDATHGIGIKAVGNALHKMCVVLLRNAGLNVEAKLIEFEQGNFGEFDDADIVDNYQVIVNTINNSSVMAGTLLMIDDFIKAGKSIKKRDSITDNGEAGH